MRAASASGVSGLVSPSRTKSALGSTITIRRSVVSMSRSRSTPSAYVLPDPLCPHRNVWRLNPAVRRLAVVPGLAVVHRPTARSAPVLACSPASCSADAGETGLEKLGRSDRWSRPSGASVPRTTPDPAAAEPSSTDGSVSTCPRTRSPVSVEATTTSPGKKVDPSPGSRRKVRPSRDEATAPAAVVIVCSSAGPGPGTVRPGIVPLSSWWIGAGARGPLDRRRTPDPHLPPTAWRR